MKTGRPIGSGRPLMDRFLQHVSPEPNSGCHLWTAAVTGKGYGKITDKSADLAHRVAYILFVGPIPDGLCVLHKCDMPSCVNPDHLFLGTRADNLADMDRKGRRRPRNTSKTECIRGHPLSGENLYVKVGREAGRRTCRTCAAMHDKEYRRIRRDARATA